MSTLHILSRQLDDSTLQSLEHSLSANDAILLTCDAIYLALKPGFLRHSQALFALEPDIAARGLNTDWPQAVTRVDHSGYVDLCIRFDKSLSWS